MSRDFWLRRILAAVVVFLVATVLILVFHFDVDQEHTKRDKIGFVMLGGIHDAGWNASQYEAINDVCRRMGAELLVKEYIRENAGDCPQAVRELADEGAGMIFLSSYSYSMEVKDLVGQYPHIAFGTNSAEYHTKNMTSYFVRLYQARYLAGAIAGMRTRSGVVGYVAAMPNSEVNRGINAFTLGAQRVNPNVRVAVAWTGSWQNEEKEALNARRLVQELGADVLTYHQDEKTVADTAEAMGVDFIGYHEALTGYSPHNLTSVVCRWDIYYMDIIRRYLKGEINSVNNHWLGIDQGVVLLSPYSEYVTPEIRKQVDIMRDELIAGNPVFSGTIYDNHGQQRCMEGEVISDDALLERIDYLVRGVETLD